MRLPAATARLFPHERPEDVADPAHRPFLIARLLEAGDRADLRWLSAEVDESALAACLAARGDLLSRRSAAFWRLLLDGDLAPAAADAEATWPP